MLNRKYLIYSFTLGMLALGSIYDQPAFARNHHKKDSPPPPAAPKKDMSLNPQQSSDDISPFAKKAAENARQQQASIQQNTNNKNGPAALLPGHYTKSQANKKINGNSGWVNSQRTKRKYDMGINEPVPQTADPTQNKTRGVFRRAMPVYTPNY